MASKRTAHEEGNEERGCQVSGKRRLGNSEQPRALYLTSVGSNSTNDMTFALAEPLFRKLLQEMIPPILEEVIPPMLQRYVSPRCGLRLNRQQSGPSGGRALRLCFMKRLPSTIFTGRKIRAEDGSKLQIALCDATFQHPRVKEDASSMKVQICVLDGDFGCNGSEDWTAEDFNANILVPRKDKPPLLNGDKVIPLENGVGYVENIVFTDPSNWTRSKMFRLGLKVWQSTSNEVDIKEGRSEPLRVKDKRGEAHEKHDKPSLDDEVWRLKRIRKNGETDRKLSSLGITTVKNLLRWYTIDEASLLQRIGNILGKSWDKIIEHAKACEIDDHERYIYQGFAAEQSVFLVFNCIYKVLKVSFDGQNYCSLESLNLVEKRLVEIVKQQAYSNLNNLKPYVEPTPHSLLTLATMHPGAPDQGLPQLYHPIAPQGPFINNLTVQQQTWPNLFQPSTSTNSIIDEAALSDQVGSSQLPDHLEEIMRPNWPAGEQLISEACNRWPISGSQIDPFAICYTPPTIQWEQQIESFCNTYDYGAESSKPVHTTSKGRAKTVWGKIRTFANVLKRFTDIAVQRKAKVFHFQD